ncbi:MAG: HAMP domain-containing sensor histidine kinase [bacterium]|nr:HAMP domain-containing sensor histidine kinase [bacterium]
MLFEGIVENQKSSQKLLLRLIGHELLKPSSRLRDQIEEIGKEADPWTMRKKVGEVLESTFRLDRLIRDVADTSAMETGSVELSKEPVNFTSLLSERLSKRIQRRRNFRFLPESPAKEIILQGNLERLSVLIDDLLDAAVNLTPEGGIILIRLTSQSGNMQLATINRDARLPAVQASSFLDWLSDHFIETKAIEGSGIGLYRSNLIANHMGGKLSLSSSEEEGVTFQVTIPGAGERAADGG